MRKHARDPQTVARKAHLLTRYREAFMKVMDAYSKLKRCIGDPGAMNYAARNPGAQNAQYKPSDDRMFRIIDYFADVDKAAADVLDAHELLSYFGLQGTDIDFSVLSVGRMRLMEKVGRVLIARGLYPPEKYFKVVKK